MHLDIGRAVDLEAVDGFSEEEVESGGGGDNGQEVGEPVSAQGDGDDHQHEHQRARCRVELRDDGAEQGGDEDRCAGRHRQH
ncbi:MAG: hypothetical protein L0K47_05315 [Acidipropionibacterium jensenii]|nr:hypothetical protein [Acidipropionibacterium jensenii]MDN6512729.1 hypothetical protein [Acidipropionibacterium jensenii]MDN6624919.1 hypothetical protein [Acidipropionibacterium jensenii]